MTPQSCDTMVALPSATAHGQTLFAKNSDRPNDECQPLELHARVEGLEGPTACQFVSVPSVATTYRHIGSRPWWCWGYEHGFNEHQVVIGNEALPSRLEPASGPKLIGMELIRLGLERGKTAREALDVMTSLVTEFGQGKFDNDANVRTYDNGYIVADPTEAYVLETAGHDWAVKKVEGALGISNVYSVGTDYDALSPTAETNGQYETTPFNFAEAYKNAKDATSGRMRRTRSCAVLGSAAGRIDVRTMMSTLSDHSDAQNPDEPFQTDLRTGGICVHYQDDGTGGNTAASLVADLCADGSRLPVYWCSFYSPCLGLFFPVFIEGTLPEVLARGGEHSSDDSPWWKFYHLSRVVREDAAERVPLVRSHWAMQQRACFSGAYAVATEAKRLLDDGASEPALEMLDGFMADSVNQMLETVDELLAEFSAAPLDAD